MGTKISISIPFLFHLVSLIFIGILKNNMIASCECKEIKLIYIKKCIHDHIVGKKS